MGSDELLSFGAEGEVGKNDVTLFTKKETGESEIDACTPG